jgi:hypothetical protein
MIMGTTQFCQSCSMPLTDTNLQGTEKDGSSSKLYCKYCYQHGEFTNPGITLDQMKEHMMKMMEKENIPEDILEAAISRLPYLQRWRTETPWQKNRLYWLL